MKPHPAPSGRQRDNRLNCGVVSVPQSLWQRSINRQGKRSSGVPGGSYSCPAEHSSTVVSLLPRLGNLISGIRIALQGSGPAHGANRCAGGTMSLTSVLLGAILLVIGCGAIFLYRMLVAITKMLEAIIELLDSIDHKLPSSRLLTSLLSF